MAEDVFDIYTTDFDTFRAKIGQIERVFDVELTVCGLPQDWVQECDTSDEKRKSKGTLRISSSKDNDKSVKDAKEYILSQSCQNARQCLSCRGKRQRHGYQAVKVEETNIEQPEEGHAPQECTCVLDYVRQKRADIDQQPSTEPRHSMEDFDNGCEVLPQTSVDECAHGHCDPAERETSRCDAPRESSPEPVQSSSSGASGGLEKEVPEAGEEADSGVRLNIPLLSPGADSNHDSCYDSDVSSNGGSRRNSSQHLDTEHSDVSRTASDTLGSEHVDDYAEKQKTNIEEDLNNATKTIESVIEHEAIINVCTEQNAETSSVENQSDAEKKGETDVVSVSQDGDVMGVPGYANKVKYCLKLGYTEDQVRAVLSQKGFDINQNELLSELIKVGSSGDPDSGDESDDEDVDQDVDQENVKPPLKVTVSNPQAISANQAETEYSVSLPRPRSHSNLSRIGVQDNASNLRPIVIDGSNVAMSHGNKEVFSCRGIRLTVDWFRQRGHQEIYVFVPQWRKEAPRPDTPLADQEILFELEREKILVFTPARRIGGKRIVCYDDRYIIRLAAENGGIVISNDNYRDLQNEKDEYREVIEKRLLMYSFVNDRFMPPEDPLGKYGPRLDNFLQKEPTVPEPVPPVCPYGKKCTYGNKCKYYHPERGANQVKSVTEKLAESAHRKIKEVQKHGFLMATDGTKKNQSPNRKQPLSKTKSLSPAAAKQPLSRTKSLQPEMRLGGTTSLLPVSLTAPNREDFSDKKLQDSPIRVSVTHAEDSARYNAKLAEYAQRVAASEKAQSRSNKQHHLGSHESLKPPNHWSLTHESLRPVHSDPYESTLGSGHLALAKKLSDEGLDSGRRGSQLSPAQSEQQLQRDIEQAKIQAEREKLEQRLQELDQRERSIKNEKLHENQIMYSRPHAKVTCTKSAGTEGMNRHKKLQRQLSLQGREDPRIVANAHGFSQNSIPGVRFHGPSGPIIMPEAWSRPGGSTEDVFHDQGGQSQPQPCFVQRPPLVRMSSVSDLGRRPMHTPVQRIPSAPVTQQNMVTSTAPTMTRQNSTSDPQLNLASEDIVAALQGGSQYPGGPADSRSIWAQKFNQMHPHLMYQGPTHNSPGVKVAFGQPPPIRPASPYDQYHPTLGHTSSNPLDAHLSTPSQSLRGSSQNLGQGFPSPAGSPRSFTPHGSNPSLHTIGQFSPHSQDMQRHPQFGSGQNLSNTLQQFYPGSQAGYEGLQAGMPGTSPYCPQQMSPADPHALLSSQDTGRPSSAQSGDSSPALRINSRSPVQYHGPCSDPPPGFEVPSEKPVLLSDPKHQHIYAHLCALFPEEDVKKVVYQFPQVTSPQKLCQHIMKITNNR